MKKKLILLTSMILNMSILADHNLLVFSNPNIHLLDGIPYMLDGEAVMRMLIVIRKLTGIQDGQKKADSTIIGAYLFNGQMLSISQLAQAESLDPHNEQLKQLLITAKHDFIKTTKPFMSDIEPAKRLILALIHEFCERRNRQDSVILSWSSAKPGQETKSFNASVKSFNELDIFLTDLILFLKDLVNSCPKAREQYKEWYKKNKQSKEQ